MDIGRLRALRELSARQTMAAVAGALHLTPSAVSQQIALLEQEAGVPLIERQGRGVRLTKAGEVLVEHTERMLTILDEAKSDLATIKREVAGTLRVATFPTVAAAVLPRAINALKKRYPYLEIVLEELEPADGLAALGSWQADLAFVDDLSLKLLGKKRDVEQIPILDDMLHVMLPAGHPLASKQSLSIADLRGERWALDSASSFYAEFVMNLCRRAGYEPVVNAAGRGFEMVSAMVAGGCSITVIPGLRLVHPVKGAVAVKLRPEIGRKISVAYRRGERKHPAIKVFIEEVVREASVLRSK